MGKQPYYSGYPDPKEPEPPLKQLQEWQNDTGCESTDGCWVEHDGVCEHGYPSWFLHLGLI